jgi:eukaryotic-like serine/threonine-protein kinase
VACLDDLTVLALVEGSGVAHRADVESHLDACAQCRALVGDAFRATRGTPSSTTIGRFVLGELLGAGAMGEVYDAYDPQLDRRVALKLVKPAADDGVVVARLLQEARIMAQLSHPHVVAVHEAALVDGVPYVVMEQVVGTTFDAWCAAAPRALDDIVRAIADVARGLAAVHAAGVIHRDIKPSNILVDADGRAKLGDFGLAGISVREPSTAAAVPELSIALTATGDLVGTPAYMAPERIRGEDAVPASDTFSLCVVLFEALYGTRPFAGVTWAELSRAVLAGERAAVPSRARRIPARIARLLDRGLAATPATRWSATELAEQIERRPVRRWWLAAGVAAALAIAFAVRTAITPVAAPDPCGGGADEIARVWSPFQLVELTRAFARDPRAVAAASSPLVSAALDRYTADWIDAHRAACVANRVRHVESDALFDRRIACLDQRKRELGALVFSLARPSADAIDHAIGAALALDPIAACTAERLPADAPRGDPARRAALEDRLARVRAADRLGSYAAAVGDAVALAADTVAYGDPRLAARALELAGELRHRTDDDHAAEASYRAALAQAARGGDDAETARLWGDVIFLVGVRASHDAEAKSLIEVAHLALARAGSPADVEAELETNIAAARTASSDVAGARASFQRAIALSEQLHGRETIDETVALSGLANLESAAGNLEVALGLYQRALAIYVRDFGPTHPMTARARLDVATALDALGRHAPARAELDAASSILVAAEGAGNWDVLATEVNLGIVLVDEGDATAAIALLQRVLARAGDRAELSGLAQHALGAACGATGDHDREARTYEQEIASREAHGARPEEIALVLVDLGGALHDAGRCAAAIARYDRAISTFETALGAAHPYLAYALAGKGRCLLDLGKRLEARTVLERARVIAKANANADVLKQIDDWVK